MKSLGAKFHCIYVEIFLHVFFFRTLFPLGKTGEGGRQGEEENKGEEEEVEAKKSRRRMVG